MSIKLKGKNFYSEHIHYNMCSRYVCTTYCMVNQYAFFGPLDCSRTNEHEGLIELVQLTCLQKVHLDMHHTENI